MNKLIHRHFIVFMLMMVILFFPGCSPGVEPPSSSSPSPSLSPGVSHGPADKSAEDILEKNDNLTLDTVPFKPPRKSGFTRQELKEINRDGYLAYFYRRKYHPLEVKQVWDAVNTLFPDYTQREKLLATRSILAYHWVVYRPTRTHDIRKNLAVTRRFHHFMEKFSELHQVPLPMVEAVITFENSGGIAKESWAACVGVGQLSMGAVNVAHSFYDQHVANLRRYADHHNGAWLNYHLPYLGYKQWFLKDRAKKLDVGARHREISKSLGIEDDRLIPECNIEDAVVYLKLLYYNYNKRMDLAISAYHNGGLNNNDIIRDYLNRRRSISLGPNAKQVDIIAGIVEKDLKFISLWEDTRCRDMLNGLRTVYGHVTTPANRRLALGDESDIYLWKAVAAYAALKADGDLVDYLVKKYNGPWDLVELSGLRIYDDVESIRRSIRSEWLVPLPKVYTDKGISGLKAPSLEYRQRNWVYDYYVGPELAGFLVELSYEYQRRTNNKKVKIPLRRALEARILELHEKDEIPQRFIPHLTGYSVEIDLPNASYRSVLEGILKEWFLHDRIYFTNKTNERRVTVNPRFGKHYYGVYQKYLKEKQKP